MAAPTGSAGRWSAPALRWPVQAGWPGAVALLAGLATLLLAAGLTPHWTAQAAHTNAQLRARTAAATSPAPRAMAPPAAPGPLVRLPEAQAHPQRVAGLLEQALRHGVRVDRLNQTLAAAPRPPTSPSSRPAPGPQTAERSTLQVQASGSVPALRAWASAVLVQDPALALDSLRWRRNAGADALWTAELHWSLWQQPAAATAARP